MKNKNSSLQEIFIGAHFSISGGVEKAIEKSVKLKCNVAQIFTKNAQRWESPPLKNENIEKFIYLKNKHNIKTASHISYLINLAENNPEKRKKALYYFQDEIKRADQLDIPYLILHPGIVKDTSITEAIKLIADAIDYSIKKSKNEKLIFLLETTAGQGNSIGHNFTQLRDIIISSKYQNRIGICLDTCHLFASGYAIHNKEGYIKTFEEFNNIIGLNKIKFIHLNDSKTKFNSNIDRHDHIGKGKMGINTFKFIMNDKNFIKIGKCLETPKGKDDVFDVMNLKLLNSLVK